VLPEGGAAKTTKGKFSVPATSFVRGWMFRVRNLHNISSFILDQADIKSDVHMETNPEIRYQSFIMARMPNFKPNLMVNTGMLHDR
jgi:hypothetical protein